MRVSEIKKKITKWRDFYGQDILPIEAIGKCKTKDDCRAILESHRRFLEDQATNASSHLDAFKKELGLY